MSVPAVREGLTRRLSLSIAACLLLAAGTVRAEVVELEEAPEIEAGDPLAQAQAAYSEIDFEGTLRYAREALDRGGYGPRQMLRIFEFVGMAAAALDRVELARDAYTRLLALDPSFQLDEGLSPRFREPFLEARGYWAARTDRLEARVILARARGALRIDTTDPLGMGHSLRVLTRLEGETEYSEAELPMAPQTYVEVPGSSEAPRVEYVVQILDRHGNRLVELGNEDAPEVVGRPIGSGGRVEEGPESRAWLWAVIGVSAAVVVASIVATGVVLGLQSGEVGIRTGVDLGLSD